jgi:hypothetical protein
VNGKPRVVAVVLGVVGVHGVVGVLVVVLLHVSTAGRAVLSLVAAVMGLVAATMGVVAGSGPRRKSGSIVGACHGG